MSVENVSASLAGVARYAQRPAKNALISNTDNSAVQQYAQVSLFTSYLAEAAPAVTQNDNPADRQPEPQQPAYSFGGSSASPASSFSGSSEPPVSVLNYSSKAKTNAIQNPNQAGQFLSLTV